MSWPQRRLLYTAFLVSVVALLTTVAVVTGETSWALSAVVLAVVSVAVLLTMWIP